jgi:DNA-binding MarR family transcriptional regulator
MAPTRQRAADWPCAAGTLRRASRSLARLYDAHLGSAGLTTTQFSILRTLQRRGGKMSLSTLATDLVFERTSLYRALVPLRRQGLVSIRDGADRVDRRAKDVAVTPKGKRRTAAAVPCWIAAQRAVLDRFGAEAWGHLATDLQHLTALARRADVR